MYYIPHHSDTGAAALVGPSSRTCAETDKEPHTRTLKEDVREGSKFGFLMRIIYFLHARRAQ